MWGKNVCRISKNPSTPKITVLLYAANAGKDAALDAAL